MRYLLAILALLLGAAFETEAATITVGPTGCTAAAVNTAIGTAANGDTVLLTCTGTVTWTAMVTIPNTKGITLQVQGGTNTPKTSAVFPLIVISNQNPAILANIGQGNAVSRISGFRFGPNTGPSDPFIEFNGAGTGVAGLGGFRLDNNYFDTISAKENIVIWSNNTLGDNNPAHGNLFGCIDNNTFHNIYRSDDTAFGPYNIQVWNFWHPAGSNQCWGCDGWINNDFVFGGPKFNFIEDNLFEQTATAPAHMRHYISVELGGRYVSRHNTFINNFPDSNADLHDAHGLCLVASNGAGNRGGEIYNNTITGSGYDRALQLRGGSWVIHDNVITAGGGNPIEFDEYRAEGPGVCSATSALTPIFPPWPVPVGATWSASAPWTTGVTNGSAYQLPQQIFNSFVWGNTAPGGAAIVPAVPSALEQQYIQPNRDYFIGTTTPPPGLASYVPYTYPDPIRGAASVATPTFSPVAGTYTSAQSVTISTTTPSATICYTIDGSTPTTNGAGACVHGTTFSSPISVSGSQTIAAVATLSGSSDSVVSSASYVISIVTPPQAPGVTIMSQATLRVVRAQ